jgi:S-adenosylmethionine decarboxylase
MSHEFTGLELMADLYDCTADLNDKSLLESLAKEAIKKANMKEVQMFVVPFSPQGIDLVSILAESSMIVHTYPEHKALFLNIFTCGRKGRPLHALNIFASGLRPKKINYIIVDRGGRRGLRVSGVKHVKGAQIFRSHT